MRLMFVITRGDVLGGAQSYARDLAIRFDADGHDILVVAGAMGVMTDALQAAGIEVMSAPGLLREIHPLHDTRSIRSLVRLIREFRPDLVTTHSSKAGIVGRVAARIAGVPGIHTANGWSFNPAEPVVKRTIYRWLERGTVALGGLVICVSDQGRQLAIDAGIGADRLVTIHNGIPDAPAEFRASPGTRGPMRLISVARFDPPKDQRTLILAVKDLANVNLDLVGTGAEEDAARELVRDLGIGDRVRFLGNRTDVPELLAGAHAFALCSRSEGFPISTLEAMRAGLPVVVSNAGGAGEAVIDGQTGYVIADDSVALWADRLARLADDPTKRGRMGGAARTLFEERFTYEQMFTKTAAVYRTAASPAVRRDRGVVETA
jgi:glycosyltransferase involved in cell wall biosynthesis